MSSDGLLQIDQGFGEFLRVHFRGAEQQVRFGGFAFAQDAVHQQLAARRLIVADESRAEQVDEGLVVGRFLFQGREQLDDLFVLAQAQVAIGQQEDRLPVGRLLLDGFRQFLRGGGDLGGLVIVPERQVHADGEVSRFEVQRLPVLDDGVFVLAGFGERRAQVGAGHDALGRLFQVGAIFGDGARNVAGLVQVDGVAKNRVGRRLLRRRQPKPARTRGQKPYRTPSFRPLFARISRIAASSSAGRKSSSPSRVWKATLPSLPIR